MRQLCVHSDCGHPDPHGVGRKALLQVERCAGHDAQRAEFAPVPIVVMDDPYDACLATCRETG